MNPFEKMMAEKKAKEEEARNKRRNTVDTFKPKAFISKRPDPPKKEEAKGPAGNSALEEQKADEKKEDFKNSLASLIGRGKPTY